MDILPEVKDRSGYVIGVAFTNELNQPVTPIAATWSLTDGNGAIINEQQDNLIIPAESVYITTQGDDNAYTDGGSRLDNTRVLVVKTEYLSALTGQPTPKNGGVRYAISDLPDV